ncbi:1-phosphofructokinase family hexose kinase [Microbacterium rhizosphaerae]|uniref:Hexose kinase n=1 Tax=Microbacterium rhizosphaerae TaxID=1678237 RepID=A0ABZ0SQY2_9MICO|nr:hexose kinase [Microbacterium rhizosphaerae]WPR90664.1 hexose kinase [Microbacterium rhizosphaerae]
MSRAQTGRIVAVTPNPALDMTWHVDGLSVGESHRVGPARVRAGGKGLNVARVAAQQGADVVAVTTCGGSTGAEFAAELAASGIPHVLVPVDPPTRRSVAIVDAATGDATVLNERGSDPGAAAWLALVAATTDAAAAAAVLVVSGSLPPGAPDAVVPELVGIAASRGIPSIVDTSGAPLLAAARAGATVLKPNRAELVEATGIDDPVAAARTLLEHGTRLVLLSLGAGGMLAVTADTEPLHARLPEVLAGNPTGAGDAAVAAASVLLACGVHDPASLLRAAVAWSAAAVLEPVAGEISPAHVEFAQRIDVFPLSKTFPMTEAR